MDIAVLVNLHARRASERVLRTVQRMMPEARVVPTRSTGEALRRMRLSHPVAFQVGGDPREVVTEVDYRIADEAVDLLDWRAVGRLAA